MEKNLTRAMHTEYSREFRAYSKANGRSPDEQMSHDDQRWLGGCMTGFICWMHDKMAEFRRLHPESFHGHNLWDHDSKCAFLEQ